MINKDLASYRRETAYIHIHSTVFNVDIGSMDAGWPVYIHLNAIRGHAFTEEFESFSNGFCHDAALSRFGASWDG